VEREILKRYFEQTSPTTEIKAVEDWLLDPGNKIAFEKFLEEEWSDHVQAKELSNIVRMKKSKSKLIWKTASAAAVLLLAFGMYQSLLVNHNPILQMNGLHISNSNHQLPLLPHQSHRICLIQ
jgi:hypothetical protein